MTTPNPNGGDSSSASNLNLLNQPYLWGQSKSTGAQQDALGQLGQTDIGGTPPPVMRTFVYSPEVRIIIAHGNKTYDVSSDIVCCSLRRAESSAATLYFTLANKGYRYTPKKGKPPFSRMDRVVVYMKRTEWKQVYSGYLDTIPYKQLYPGTVDFKATCTIKRLMHTWWNPGLPLSQQILNQFNPQVGSQGDGQAGNDSNMGSILRKVLIMVGGWRVDNVHIQNFPTVFYDFLKQQSEKNQKVNDDAGSKFKTLILGSDTSPAPGSSAGYNPNAGAPGPQGGGVAAAGPLGAGTEFYIKQIIAACDEKGLGPLVSDNVQGAALAQAGETGQQGSGFGTASQQKAFQTVQQTGLDQQSANRKSDAAILGAACAAVETGGGVAIKNYYNPIVPGSKECQPNDGYPPGGGDHDSVGIFQQRNLTEWGTVEQRMNPKQSAGMFFEHLTRMAPNWRNMDPAAAIQVVQRSNGAPYAGAVAWATTQVQAIRGASGAAATATGGLAGAVGGVAGGAAPSTNTNLVPAVPSVTPGVAAGTAVAGSKPSPDSEGAINWGMTQLGKPYIWGGEGPAGYDCSGLVKMAFKSIGVQVPHSTQAIAATYPKIPASAIQRGDLCEPFGNDHVFIWLGNGTILESGGGRSPGVHVIPTYCQPAQMNGIYRVIPNGGTDPTAHFSPPETMGPGNPVGGMEQQGGGTSQGSSGSSEGVAKNLFSYIFTPGQFTAEVTSMLPGEKAFLDGQPLIQIVQAITGASLRKFQSTPNGDFMAYYPDWWGLDGKPAVMRLEDIELKDVRINFSDDPLTTHVYIEGDYTMLGFDNQMLGWLITAGVATVEDTWLYQRLIKVAPGDPETASGQEIMRRYGIRPLKQTYAMAGSHELELILACQVFMEKWAQQFQTTISMTFMPELYPGMRVELASHNLSVYVTEVNHICDYEQGFSTTATIMAPSNPSAKTLIENTTTPGSKPTDSVQGGFDNPGGIPQKTPTS